MATCSKTADVDDLLRAVRAVQRGESALSPEITQKVLRQLQIGPPGGRRASRSRR